MGSAGARFHLTPGSHERAAEAAAVGLVRAGATHLEMQIGMTVAAHGDNCWLNDRATGEHIRRSDGRRYHRGSIGRARRSLVKKRLLSSTRVFPTGLLPSGKRSSQGTTIKRVLWNRIGKRCPLTRPAKRQARTRQESIDLLCTSAQQSGRKGVPVPPELLAMLAKVAASPLISKRLPKHSSYFPRPMISTATTGQSAASMTPAEAKARLAAWELEQKERGPP